MLAYPGPPLDVTGFKDAESEAVYITQGEVRKPRSANSGSNRTIKFSKRADLAELPTNPR